MTWVKSGHQPISPRNLRKPISIIYIKNGNGLCMLATHPFPFFYYILLSYHHHRTNSSIQHLFGRNIFFLSINYKRYSIKLIEFEKRVNWKYVYVCVSVRRTGNNSIRPLDWRRPSGTIGECYPKIKPYIKYLYRQFIIYRSVLLLNISGWPRAFLDTKRVYISNTGIFCILCLSHVSIIIYTMRKQCMKIEFCFVLHKNKKPIILNESKSNSMTVYKKLMFVVMFVYCNENRISSSAWRRGGRNWFTPFLENKKRGNLCIVCSVSAMETIY